MSQPDSPAPGRTFYIVGAGIAGLTLALALAKFGATVVVLERNAAISEFGAGLQISPNARRVLNQLGLDSAIAAKSLEPSGIDIFPYGRRKPLVTLALGSAVRSEFGEPYVVMHRADLVDALFKACRRFANIDIVFNVREWDAISHARGASITVDQTTGGGRSGRAFAVVGADGVHSQARTRLLEGPEAKYAGRAAWRALVPMAELSDVLSTERTSVLFGPDFHLVAYPLPHRGQFNIVLFSKMRVSQARSNKVQTTPALPRALLPSARLNAILRATRTHWTFWPMYKVDTPRWSAGAIGLIGDAAHAMLPFQAQGAAMAIEDAAILAPLLMTEPDAVSAFARYETIRRPRVARVARTAGANGKIFHLKWPWTIGRDLVLRLQGPTSHFRRLRWLYDYHVAPETSGKVISPPPR
ncbi:FAD-dependent oxidoreductase [Devosia sp.]|uniref:FAD-dependent oxidoreductase n=1 Tax=Devosia sp. TaxID=1871048 RepID=UPI0032636640